MQKRKADQFIAANIQKYGLTGSNVTPNDAKHPKLSGNGVLYFSKDNHFVWGYNGKSYTNRRSSSCMYFTDYLTPRYSGTILPLDATLIDIAEQLYKEFGCITVVNRGRVEDIAFVHACFAAEIDFEQIVVDYSGGFPYNPDLHQHPHQYPNVGVSPMSFVEVTPDLILDTARIVTDWLRTKSIDVIQDIAIARSTTNKLVYPSRMNFINHNSDDGTPCGPAYWALCDAEEDTALLRYGWYDEGMSHLAVANLATWHPDLMLSQLHDPILRKCLLTDAANASHATDMMWQNVTPVSVPPREKPEWWDAVQDEINRMHDGGKCNEKWYTPVQNMGATYGTVL